MMQKLTYPIDQSLVVFTDKNGFSREGKYVESMEAFVEIEGNEGPGDCSNVFPQADIASWELLNRPDQDGGLIEAF